MEVSAVSGSSDRMQWPKQVRKPDLDEMKAACQLTGKRTFLDVESFEYSGEVIAYCNGTLRPMDDGSQFLAILGVVLAVTDTTIQEVSQVHQDQFKEAVRERFLTLYTENKSDLLRNAPSSELHGAVEVAFSLDIREPSVVSTHPQPARDGAPVMRKPIRGVGRRSIPSGNGGRPFVKMALILLAGYLTYRFVGKPAYQWIRGSKGSF
ncbi:MAG: hypothetical protein KFB93_00010 [Simkaniaceae bacterium]|nr:MAG: hypothetical protein KFB93_00010 [Simkaniaceae bacterium]